MLHEYLVKSAIVLLIVRMLLLKLFRFIVVRLADHRG